MKCAATTAAIPSAFGTGALLFAGSYVALQVGRNCAGAVLLSRDHALRETFERIVAWSLAFGVGGPAAGFQLSPSVAASRRC